MEYIKGDIFRNFDKKENVRNQLNGYIYEK